MSRKRFALTAVLILLALSTSVDARDQWSKWKQKLKGESLSDDTVVSGLKEALHVGSENAVGLTGKPGGYFENEAIKILMPQKLRKLNKVLRKVGFDQQLDAFVLSMNRAAESAAPQAKDVFWGAIKEMSFDDARSILGGGDTAATDYFRANTSDKLTAVFAPIVERSMDEVGVTQNYQQLVKRYETMPFVKAESLDLEAYVVTGALDGLFKVLGDEERKIRKDPAARVTDVLKNVFGKK